MKSISKKQVGDKLIFTFSVVNRSRSKKVCYSVEKILEMIKRKYDTKDYVFLKSKSSGQVDNSNMCGDYIFEKKHVDNLKNNVIINKTKIEADVQKEQKKEASPPKVAKKTTRRKRAPRKKKTEE